MHKKILLIEDEKLLRKMYRFTFMQNGYEVDIAGDGEQALQKLTQTQPDYDLIILDLMLPKLDGISVLKKIKQHGSPAKNIPVFVLTNLGMDKVLKDALKYGAEQFFIKLNYTPKQIVEEVTTYFKRQQK